MMHIERNEEAKNDPIFIQTMGMLATKTETFAIKYLSRFSVHEFTTVMLYYLQHDNMMSKILLQKMI